MTDYTAMNLGLQHMKRAEGFAMANAVADAAGAEPDLSIFDLVPFALGQADDVTGSEVANGYSAAVEANGRQTSSSLLAANNAAARVIAKNPHASVGRVLRAVATAIAEIAAAPTPNAEGAAISEGPATLFCTRLAPSSTCTSKSVEMASTSGASAQSTPEDKMKRRLTTFELPGPPFPDDNAEEDKMKRRSTTSKLSELPFPDDDAEEDKMERRSTTSKLSELPFPDDNAASSSSSYTSSDAKLSLSPAQSSVASSSNATSSSSSSKDHTPKDKTATKHKPSTTRKATTTLKKQPHSRTLLLSPTPINNAAPLKRPALVPVPHSAGLSLDMTGGAITVRRNYFTSKGWKGIINNGPSSSLPSATLVGTWSTTSKFGDETTNANMRDKKAYSNSTCQGTIYIPSGSSLL